MFFVILALILIVASGFLSYLAMLVYSPDKAGLVVLGHALLFLSLFGSVVLSMWLLEVEWGQGKVPDCYPVFLVLSVAVGITLAARRDAAEARKKPTNL